VSVPEESFKQQAWSCGCFAVDSNIVRACSSAIEAANPSTPPFGGVVRSVVCFRLLQEQEEEEDENNGG
jgi:hypothetical protein